MPSTPAPAPLAIEPATPDRWPDIETLFGERGAVGGCWCMWWRLKRSDYNRQRGDANRAAFRMIVQAGDVPGLLAYSDGRPVGWCAIAPRVEYPALDRSRILKPVDDQPVWSVTCFFVDRGARGQGVTVRLLAAAVRHAARHGARLVEGYPVEPAQGAAVPAAFAFTGLAAAFRQAGFVEVARRSPTRPIMRFDTSALAAES